MRPHEVYSTNEFQNEKALGSNGEISCAFVLGQIKIPDISCEFVLGQINRLIHSYPTPYPLIYLNSEEIELIFEVFFFFFNLFEIEKDDSDLIPHDQVLHWI